MDPPGASLETTYVDMERDIHCERRVQSSAEASRQQQEVAAHGRTQPQPEQRKLPPSLPRFKDQAMGHSERSVLPVAVIPEEAAAAAMHPATQQQRTTNSPWQQEDIHLPRFKDQAMEDHVAPAIPVAPTNVYGHPHRQISGLTGPTFKDQMREAAPPPMVSSRHIHAMTDRPQSLSRDTFIELQNEGFPSGLIQQLDALKQVYAARYWIVDNSGSMLKPDCVRFVPHSQKVAGCSRWDELCRTVEQHAALAAKIHAKTYFRWLNDPGARLGPAEICIQNQNDVDILRRTMEQMQPGGRTPLTQHIQELEQLIRNADYESTGQKAVVVIATDGLPTDLRAESTEQCKTEFVQALRRLGSLQVWIVVRLCTNDEDVIEYYRKLDGQLEFEIEVIDDFVNEAKQVARFNGWLGYVRNIAFRVSYILYQLTHVYTC